MQLPSQKMTSSQEEIHDRAMQRTKEYLAQQGHLLASLIEVDKNQVFKCFGYTYLTPYCVIKLGLSEDVAACFVRVVRKSHVVPELAQAVVSGDLHLTKARTIAAVITPENKDEWLNRAATESKVQLEQSVAMFSGRETKPFTLNLTFEEHQLFRRVQEVLSAKLNRYPTREEAQNWMMEFALDKTDPVRKADRSRDRLKDQVNHRDQGQCQVELPDGKKCGEKKWNHHHHLLPKEYGGEDSIENLVTVCAGHHRMIHKAMES